MRFAFWGFLLSTIGFLSCSRPEPPLLPGPGKLAPFGLVSGTKDVNIYRIPDQLPGGDVFDFRSYANDTTVGKITFSTIGLPTGTLDSMESPVIDYDRKRTAVDNRLHFRFAPNVANGDYHARIVARADTGVVAELPFELHLQGTTNFEDYFTKTKFRANLSCGPYDHRNRQSWFEKAGKGKDTFYVHNLDSVWSSIMIVFDSVENRFTIPPQTIQDWTCKGSGRRLRWQGYEMNLDIEWRKADNSAWRICNIKLQEIR